MSHGHRGPDGWGIVVPVKGGPRAKSRLRADPALADPGLALAFAADTLAAVADCSRVSRLVLVGGEQAALDAVRPAPRAGLALEALVQSGRGLDAAVRQGAAHLAEVAPDLPGAVLLGDLPALHTEAFARALNGLSKILDDEADLRQVFVPDAGGTGTVLLAARRPRLLDPAFGEGSAAAHEALGARRLPWTCRGYGGTSTPRTTCAAPP